MGLQVTFHPGLGFEHQLLQLSSHMWGSWEPQSVNSVSDRGSRWWSWLTAVRGTGRCSRVGLICTECRTLSQWIPIVVKAWIGRELTGKIGIISGQHAEHRPQCGAVGRKRSNSRPHCALWLWQLYSSSLPQSPNSKVRKFKIVILFWWGFMDSQENCFPNPEKTWYISVFKFVAKFLKFNHRSPGFNPWVYRSQVKSSWSRSSKGYLFFMWLYEFLAQYL